MKKTASVVLAVLAVLFVFTSCGDKKANEEYDQVVGFYSVNSTDGDIMVHFDSKVGAYEMLYDENDVHLKLAKGAKIIDADGNEIQQSDINYGDALVISYDGTLEKKNPKTIKVFELQKQS